MTLLYSSFAAAVCASVEMDLLTVNLSTNLMKYSTFDINSPMVSESKREADAFYKNKKKRVRR